MDTLQPTYRAFWAESIISILQKGKAIHITGMGQVLGISSPAGSSNYRLTLLSPKGKLRSQKVSFRDRRGFGVRGLLQIIAPSRGGAIRECEGEARPVKLFLFGLSACSPGSLISWLPNSHRKALPGIGSWGSHPPCSKHRTGTGAQAPLTGSQKKS